MSSKFKSGDYVTDRYGKTTIVRDGFYKYYYTVDPLDDRVNFWRIATKEEIDLYKEKEKEKEKKTELEKLLEKGEKFGCDFEHTSEPKFKIEDYVTDRYKNTSKIINFKMYNCTQYPLDRSYGWRFATEDEISRYKDQEFERERDDLCYRQKHAKEQMLYYQQEVAYYERQLELLLLDGSEQDK